MKIIDNFLENDFFNHIQELFTYQISYKYGQKSAPGEEGNIFMVAYLNIEEPLLKYIANKITMKTKSSFTGCYANLQFNGMGGDWHTDPGDFTAILMLSKTLEQGSGQFQIKTPKESVDFVSNRLVVFKANKKHRGLAPKEINVPRITLTFKSANS